VSDEATARHKFLRRLKLTAALCAFAAVAFLAGIACARSDANPSAPGGAGWSEYGGDAGGSRFSAAAQITPANVDRLVPVWRFETGDTKRYSAKVMRSSKLEATPILVDGRLLLCTPFNDVVALDPGTGKLLWRYAANLATAPPDFPGNAFNCRGVGAWTDSKAPAAAPCRARVFMGTNDARLIALDAKDGKLCDGFGDRGTVRISPGMDLLWPGEFQIDSAPVVADGVVVVGSAMADNQRVAAPHGSVHAFDARTGAPRWSWDPIPRDPSDPATKTWGDGWHEAGQANVWAPMSVDVRRGLVFLPTTSPSPDFYGGLRSGANLHADSVVALKIATGVLVWSYQVVHHDVWDYDLPAQPTLVTLKLPGGPRAVVVQPTKQGFLFVLDRDTGAPVFPVEEKPVPQGGVPGEQLSPTQPIPTHVPALVPQRITADQAYGLTPWDRGACRKLIAGARNDGLYTPPSKQGTIEFPFTGGGVNWGGIAFDPVHQIVYANTTQAMHLITLFASERYKEVKAKNPGREVSPQRGAPYGMMRTVVLSPLGLPCNPPPWGTLAAVDLQAGKILWRSTLGTTEELAPLGLALHTGTPSIGGPVVTAGGLVFIGSTMDKYLRAFDARTGKELWQGRLPATAQATPMTYEWRGRQFVVIAAGGHRDLGTAAGDSFVAFALPRAGESGPSLRSRTIDRPGGRFRLGGALAALIVAGGIAGWMWLRRRARSDKREQMVRPTR
jgi:quinoprotein glucose dehydrogenase